VLEAAAVPRSTIKDEARFVHSDFLPFQQQQLLVREDRSTSYILPSSCKIFIKKTSSSKTRQDNKSFPGNKVRQKAPVSLLFLMSCRTDRPQDNVAIMPRKAAAPGGEDQLTATELKLLRAIATLMPEAPKVSFRFVFITLSTHHHILCLAAVHLPSTPPSPLIQDPLPSAPSPRSR